MPLTLRDSKHEPTFREFKKEKKEPFPHPTAGENIIYKNTRIALTLTESKN